MWVVNKITRCSGKPKIGQKFLFTVIDNLGENTSSCKMLVDTLTMDDLDGSTKISGMTEKENTAVSVFADARIFGEDDGHAVFHTN